MADWDRYLAWNEAIAACVFPPLQTPSPAYLDLEDEQLELLGEWMDLPPDEVLEELASAVATTLDLEGGPQRVFSGHSIRLRRWRTTRADQGGLESPPPVLALLALLSATAESMRQADGMSDANYYGDLPRCWPPPKTRTR